MDVLEIPKELLDAISGEDGSFDGTLAGRRVTVTNIGKQYRSLRYRALPQKRKVVVTISTSLTTRLAICRRGQVGRAVDRALGMVFEDGAAYGYPDCEVSIAESEWGADRIRLDAVADCVHRLMGSSGTSVLHLRPEKMVFSRVLPDLRRLAEVESRQVADDLFSLLGLLEVPPGPTRVVAKSQAERFLDQPGAGKRVRWGCLLGAGLFVVLTVAAGMGVLLWAISLR